MNSNIKNCVSDRMLYKLQIIDELIAGGDLEPVKPMHHSFPICLIPQKTSKFNNAPIYLQRKYLWSLFSSYAFWLSYFAYAQSLLELPLITLMMPYFCLGIFIPVALGIIRLCEIAFLY